MKKLSPKAAKILTGFIDLVYFIIGSSVFALGLNMFAVPNAIASGGVTGLATIINHFFPALPVGAVMLTLNIPLFVLAFIFLGKKLFVKSFAATVILSVVTDVFSRFIPAGTNDRLLAALFYGVCSGVGLGLVFTRNATSGGTDIIAKLINKKYPHMSLGRMVLATDFIVVVIAGIAFGNIESALYSAIVVFISGEVIDIVLYGSGHGRTFLIITTKPKEVSEEIISQLKRGVTIVPARGAYTDEEKALLVCALRTPQVNRLNKIVREIDEHAFIIINESSEIIGEGFKSLEEEDNK